MIDLLKNIKYKEKRLIALIDGEHYPEVTYDAIMLLKNRFIGNFAGIVFLGGLEKLITSDLGDYYNEKVYKIGDIDSDFVKALDFFNPDIVYDLSDEPVVNYIIRMKIASFCLASECSYMGPDFLFEYEEKNITTDIPTIAVMGTGKRVGKTAVSAYISELINNENKNVCVVAIGRGGPKEPKVIHGGKVEITPKYLLDLSQRGFHASSDYIEDAFSSKITTVGCRRCGGGFGGKFFMSNIKEGMKTAESLNPDLIIVEGSGASIPAVKTDKTVCVLGACQSWENIIGYLGIYRIMCADLIFITMCEEPMADKEKIEFLEKEIKKINPDAKIVKSIFRPKPLSDIRGRKIIVVMTAKNEIASKIKNYIEQEYDCRVMKISFNLADREKLKNELEQYRNYDSILTELKAAAVDLVTDFAFSNKKDIFYMINIPIILENKEILKEELIIN